MTCGKKYEAMLVTSNNGYTPDNAYGLFATPYDYSEWRELAYRLSVRTRQHLDRLKAAEKTEDETIRSNELVDRYNSLVEEIDALPGLLGGTWAGQVLEQSIAQAVSAAREAACTMELIDSELEHAGLTPPAEPDGRKPKTKPLDLSGLGNTLMLGGLIYLGWKAYKS